MVVPESRMAEFLRWSMSNSRHHLSYKWRSDDCCHRLLLWWDRRREWFWLSLSWIGQSLGRSKALALSHNHNSGYRAGWGSGNPTVRYERVPGGFWSSVTSRNWLSSVTSVIELPAALTIVMMVVQDFTIIGYWLIYGSRRDVSTFCRQRLLCIAKGRVLICLAPALW